MSSLKIISSIKNKKQKEKKTRQIVDVWKKNQENENYFIGFIIYRPMPSLWKEKKNFSSPYIYLKK